MIKRASERDIVLLLSRHGCGRLLRATLLLVLRALVTAVIAVVTATVAVTATVVAVIAATVAITAGALLLVAAVTSTLGSTIAAAEQLQVFGNDADAAAALPKYPAADGPR